MGRWTDVAQWLGPIANSGDGDGLELEPEDRMGRVMGMVVHTAEGSFAGTIAWQRNPSADVGSHLINAKDGRRAQMIDTRDRSWCQSAGNTYWVSSENEGFGSRGEALTPQQIESNAQEFARLVKENPHIPLQVSNSPSTPGLGWHGMGGAAWGGHYDCPGNAIRAQLPAIVARAAEILGGDDMAGQTADYVAANVPVPGSPGKVMGLHVAIGSLVAAVQEERVRDAGEATAIAGLRGAIDALAATISKGGGSVDVAAITAAINARTAEVKQLVESKHAEEMAALQAERNAEVAGLQAELAALRLATS